MVAIPYKEGTSVLYAIKPRKRTDMTLKDMLKQLNTEKLEKLIEKSENKTTILRFPKMKLKSRYELKEILASLGIKSMFSSAAHFGLMIDTLEGMNKTDEELLIRISEDLDPIARDDLKTRLRSLPNPGIHVDSILHEVEMNINGKFLSFIGRAKNVRFHEIRPAPYAFILKRAIFYNILSTYITAWQHFLQPKSGR